MTYKRSIIWNTIESINHLIEAVNHYSYPYESEYGNVHLKKKKSNNKFYNFGCSNKLYIFV